ncbi:hypothetical protein DPMN_008606 [Dreissena polymorpha]|uniref:Uncharacterized protein n=1 Tax=Dreissena polymorpha TaxID=45954 RepID=A0A9D4RZE4_DREPO|nr:hypothetical protein DPMN_008606 [Dreissena polymorpha]
MDPEQRDSPAIRPDELCVPTRPARPSITYASPCYSRSSPALCENQLSVQAPGARLLGPRDEAYEITT